MPKVASSRARTVAAPKKPAPKTKAKTEKKVAPKSTGWSAKTGGTKGKTEVRGNTAGGRGSDVSTRDSRERIANMYAGGRGSDNSTSGSRQRIADMYTGGGNNS
jgi:hypothetical protein